MTSQGDVRLINGCSEAGRGAYGGGEEVRVLSSLSPVPLVPILHILRRQDHRQICVQVYHALNKYTLIPPISDKQYNHLKSVGKIGSECQLVLPLNLLRVACEKASGWVQGELAECGVGRGAQSCAHPASLSLCSQNSLFRVERLALAGNLFCSYHFELMTSRVSPQEQDFLSICLIVLFSTRTGFSVQYLSCSIHCSHIPVPYSNLSSWGHQWFVQLLSTLSALAQGHHTLPTYARYHIGPKRRLPSSV